MVWDGVLDFTVQCNFSAKGKEESPQRNPFDPAIT